MRPATLGLVAALLAAAALHAGPAVDPLAAQESLVLRSDPWMVARSATPGGSCGAGPLLSCAATELGLEAAGSARQRQVTLGTGELILQAAAGVAGAWLGGMGAWSVVDDPEAPDRKVKGDSGYQPNANTAYAVGSWVGSTLAVYAVGKAFDRDTGSLAGTAIGTGIVSALLLLGRDEPYLPLIGVAVGAPLQAIAGVIGYGR